MRDALKKAVEKAICIECKLPHTESGVNKSCLSTARDICFKNNNSEDLAKVIYNGIVEFAINEYEIDYDNLEKEQLKAIQKNLRYSYDDNVDVKLKYGFYGEVLLDLILRTFMKTSVLAARGYFYSPIENSEPKGFDAFHLIEKDGRLDLWFGEAKFYVKYKKPITDVMEKLNISLSDRYINKNLLAIINERNHIKSNSKKLNSLLDSWEDNPRINLAQEMKAQDIRLTYPIFIAYQKAQSHEFHTSVQNCIDHITTEFKRIGINIPASFDYRLFFIFLPLSEVKQIKESVIEWIDSQEPLI